MTERDIDNSELIRKLSHQFGNYRAEWNGDDVFSHFTTPGYFAHLEQFRPCVLQGGRGSGKTTTLKGLSYQGQFRIHNEQIDEFDKALKYIGLYRRIDTNHVRVFRGDMISTDVWGKLFGHFFNLCIALDVVSFLDWHKLKKVDDAVLEDSVLQHACDMLQCGRGGGGGYSELKDILREEIYRFQCYVNNVTSKEIVPPYLSVIGDPVQYLMSSVCALRQFQGKHFFILLDEYENLEAYQQAIINTLIKHSSDVFTFKIGIREQGWKEKHTVNETESLNDPADYSLLDIDRFFEEKQSFGAFAKDICQKRFSMVLEGDSRFDIEDFLTDLSNEEEARLLGVEQTEAVRTYNALPAELRDGIGDIPALYKFSIVQWAEMQGVPVEEEAQKVIDVRKDWDVRYNNYKYQMLFRIKSGRGSGGVQKYYCGFETLVKLSANNIRYFMQLVYKIFEAHLDEGNSVFTKVSPELQTRVTRNIGEKNLAQLEGECREGSQIVRLLLGLGKIFNYKAKKDRSAAEINQIVVSGLDSDDEMKALIDVAVLHLALIRFPGDKLNEFETKKYGYCIHPIFAPFFIFSYRRKRKMVIPLSILRGLSMNPDYYVKLAIQAESNHGAGQDVQPELNLGV